MYDALVNHMKMVWIKIIRFLITNTVKYSFVEICVSNETGNCMGCKRMSKF